MEKSLLAQTVRRHFLAKRSSRFTQLCIKASTSVTRTVSAKNKHKMKKHTERRRVIINPNVGFFSIDTESIQAEQRKQKPPSM